MSKTESQINITDPSERFVIVIGREFGSGGRRIGKLLSERLGCAYYDKRLLIEAAESMGFTPDIFNEHDEKKPSLFNSFFQGVYGITQNYHDITVGGAALYREQSKAIKKLSEKGPCIIVGRTADYVLRDHPRLLSVFLHSPLDHRAHKIVERGEADSLEHAKEMATKRDRDRENYYNYYTGRRWGRASNYHLTLDASRLSDEQIADVIIRCLGQKITAKR
ncbi:MAG: cytidylate kinase-like family protein [Muribaculaceae bacterium]|nr:cytidylate kinase-like family protein [Muribaculaceae bacterium]